MSRKLASRSGCHPKLSGQVKQTLLTTDDAEVLEVRLEIADVWQAADAAQTMDFRFFRLVSLPPRRRQALRVDAFEGEVC